MKLNLERLSSVPVHIQQVEIVERKGKGHPDTICDMAAEELSINLSRYYLEKFGRVLHHNVDKCILAGGSSDVTFGGGKVTKPIYLLLVGRATSEVGGTPVPVAEMVVEGTRKWLKETFRFLDVNKNIEIDHRIRPGSIDLVAAFDKGVDVPLANDTSIGVSFYPLSETERLVREVELYLNSKEIKEAHAYIGEDIKVMGVRIRDEITLTVAVAFISSLIQSLNDYMEIKRRVSSLVTSFCSSITARKVVVAVNTADVLEREAVYITVTGTSAESGDDGQVGRGNRVGGLITPYRPMTLEATAGKNAISHVGKLYNIAARNIAERVASADGVEEVYCYLVSRIGRPITEPQAVDLKVRSKLDDSDVKQIMEEAVEIELKGLPFLWKKVINREFELF
ncbi:MAG: methionine adenosyltransferase [Deltaproteobacteria bacterium]